VSSAPENRRPFLLEPTHPIGGFLWRLSRHRHANLATYAGLVVLVGGLYTLSELEAGGVFGGVGIVAVFALTFGSIIVSNMSTQRLCWRCERLNRTEFAYCCRCGAEFEPGHTAGSYLPAEVTD